MNDSEKNLIEFYREVGAMKSVAFTENDYFSTISGKEGSWPQMVFNLHFWEEPEAQLDKILTQSVQLQLPPFAVCNTELFVPENQYLLQNPHIFPIQFWTLMEVKSSEHLNKSAHSDFEIRRLNGTRELEAFTNLVNAELLQSTNINLQVVGELAENSSLHFYGLFIENELVSGLLVFTQQKMAGLYFIVTKKQYRGNGLAASLIGFVLNELFYRGIEKVVLQAVQKAVPLYIRMGFTPCGEMVIFWKR